MQVNWDAEKDSLSVDGKVISGKVLRDIVNTNDVALWKPIAHETGDDGIQVVTLMRVGK